MSEKLKKEKKIGLFSFSFPELHPFGQRCQSDSGIIAISPCFGYPQNYFQWEVNVLFSFLQIRNLVKKEYIRPCMFKVLDHKGY